MRSRCSRRAWCASIPGGCRGCDRCSSSGSRACATRPATPPGQPSTRRPRPRPRDPRRRRRPGRRAAARPPVPRRTARGRSGAPRAADPRRREVVDGVVGWDAGAPPGFEGTRLPRRADRPSRQRAARLRPGRSRRGRRDRRGSRPPRPGRCGRLARRAGAAEYRRRVEQLRAEADDAIAAGLLETAEAKQAELDELVAELARAFGLGGRDRRAASAAERARLNVTRALRAAIARLTEALPGAGEVLDRRVRTGLYCAYVPADDDEVRWIVQS